MSAPGIHIRYLLFFGVMLLPVTMDRAFAQASGPAHVTLINPKEINLNEIGLLPKILKEASGLELSRKNHLWTHNDDGPPVLYCMDTLGRLVKTIKLDQINSGWEDLTQDNEGNFYIGAFGNNKNDKKDIKIFKIPNPELINEPIVKPGIIQYNYADQTSYPASPAKKNFDVDAFMSFEEKLYLFTKNRTKPYSGYTKIYSLPQQEGQHIATLMDSIYLGNGPMMNQWITSVDMSPDKKTIALLFHDHIWLIRAFKGDKFSTGNIYQINLNNYSHKAGICFSTNNKLFIVDELEMDILGGKLYAIDLKSISDNLK